MKDHPHIHPHLPELGTRFTGPHYRHESPSHDPEASKRMREEQEAAEARRVKEEAKRKAMLEQEREKGPSLSS